MRFTEYRQLIFKCVRCTFRIGTLEKTGIPSKCMENRITVSHFGIQVSKKQTFFPAHSLGSNRGRDAASSALHHQGSNFGSCVWKAVSSHSAHHPKEALSPARFIQWSMNEEWWY